MLVPELWAWLRNSHISPPTAAIQHHSWYTQETLVLESGCRMKETTCWREEVGPPWIIAADWIAILGQPLSHLLVPWESGVWTPHWNSPCPGLAWTLFRWLLHMLSSLNQCPITLHLMCLLPETKHRLIHSCRALRFELNRGYKGKWRMKDGIESLLIKRACHWLQMSGIG